MGFQSTIAFDQGFGVVGELAFDGPVRATPGVVKAGTATAADIVVGRAFTIDAADNKYQPGGAGAFGGILANPKTQASFGTQAGGALAPTMTLAEGTVGEFVTMGEPIVALGNSAKIGDLVQFKDSDGTLKALPPVVTYTGEIAVTTGILTVSGASAGANLGVGSPVVGTGVPGGTFITALGTGTGGDGTYQTNITTAVASFSDGVAPNNADAGYTIAPYTTVVRYANTAAGLAVIALTGA